MTFVFLVNERERERVFFFVLGGGGGKLGKQFYLS